MREEEKEEERSVMLLYYMTQYFITYTLLHVIRAQTCNLRAANCYQCLKRQSFLPRNYVSYTQLYLNYTVVVTT